MQNINLKQNGSCRICGSGHETVPYFEHKFESFDNAYKYVHELQVNRRNLESSELLRNVSRLLGTC